MILTGAAIAIVLLIGQSGAVPPAPPPPPRRLDPVQAPAPSPTYGPDRSRRVRPRGNPGLWVTTDDYPSRALREEREGVVTVQLGVGPSGRAFTCGIRLSSGSVDLDEAACRNIIRRARFEPELDGNGQARVALWPIAVRWAIPSDSVVAALGTVPAQATRETTKPWLDTIGRGPEIAQVRQPLPTPLNEPGALATREEFRPPPVLTPDGFSRLQASRSIWLLRLSIDAQGQVSGCAPTPPSLDPAFDDLLCQRYAQQVRFSPAHDEAGRPTASWTYANWTLPVAPPPPAVP